MPSDLPWVSISRPETQADLEMKVISGIEAYYDPMVKMENMTLTTEIIYFEETLEIKEMSALLRR